MRSTVLLLSVLTVALLVPQAARAQVTARLETAAVVFDEVMGTPDRAIPSDLLRRAECFVIVPGVKKGAFIVGGKYGRGFLSCRQNGAWSAPAGVIVEGGSVGFQVGGSETDVFLSVMNERGAKRLLSSRFTLGVDASVAAGPIGRTVAAHTDAKMTAEILSWSRARGVFAGVALEGATLRDDAEANLDLYGRRLSNREIVTGSLPLPPAAKLLIERLSKY